MKEKKLLKGSLVGVNWNAFAILWYFVQQARRQGWEQKEIQEVLDEAKSSNYEHLLHTIAIQFKNIF